MIEQDCRLACNFAHIESVVHYEKNVHIVRCGLRSYERAEDDETSQRSSGVNERVNAFESASNNCSAGRASAETLDHVRKPGGVNVRRQIARIIEWRPFFHQLKGVLGSMVAPDQGDTSRKNGGWPI